MATLAISTILEDIIISCNICISLTWNSIEAEECLKLYNVQGHSL